jgi:uroporphyrinogen decarboxylase
MGAIALMSHNAMTPRERWLAVLNRQTPDRLPMDIWVTPEAQKNLCRHLSCDWEAALAQLHIDAPLSVGGHYVGHQVGQGCNCWGVRHLEVSHGSGTYLEAVYAPLAENDSVEEIAANYRWPQPDDWEYSHIAAQVKGQEHRPIRGGGSEPFLTYQMLRGDMQAYMDLVENPEIVDYCLDKLFDLAYQDTLRIYEAIPGQVMISYVAEDLGSQQSLLMSREHIHRYLFPGMKRMIDLVHGAGAYVFHHSDGAIREVIPDLIELGIDVLNPLQWRLPGMAREGLKHDYGDRIIFHGGVDNQSTLPFGSVAEVRQEVRENIEILGEGGGYILAPCHNIQSLTPPENIVAMYEAGYEFGHYQ